MILLSDFSFPGLYLTFISFYKIKEKTPFIDAFPISGCRVLSLRGCLELPSLSPLLPPSLAPVGGLLDAQALASLGPESHPVPGTVIRSSKEVREHW